MPFLAIDAMKITKFVIFSSCSRSPNKISSISVLDVGRYGFGESNV